MKDVGRSGTHGGAWLVLVAAVLWGTTGTAATFAPSAGPIAIGSAAMGIGGLLQALVAIRPLLRDAALLRARPGVLALGAVSVAVYPLAFYAGMHLAGVAIGTVVALASGPIFAAVLERVVDGVPLDRRWALSAALGVAGTALLAIDGASAESTWGDGTWRDSAVRDSAVRGSASGDAGGQMPLGIVLALVAGATYALYTWAARRIMRAGAGSRAAMGAVFGIGGLLLVPVLVATGGPFLADAQNLAVGAYMAVVPMFLGYLCFGAGLRTVAARSATVLTLAEPVVAAVLAWAVVGERLGPLGLGGIALIGACLAALSFPRRG